MGCIQNSSLPHKDNYPDADDPLVAKDAKESTSNKRPNVGVIFDKKSLASSRDPDKELCFYNKTHVEVTDNQEKQCYHLLTFGYTRQIIDDHLNLYIDYYDMASIILKYIIPLKCINAPLFTFRLSDYLVECKDETRDTTFTVSRHNIMFINESINYKPSQSIVIQKNNCKYSYGDNIRLSSIVSDLDSKSNDDDDRVHLYGSRECRNRYIYNAKLFVIGIKNIVFENNNNCGMLEHQVSSQSVLNKIKQSIQNVTNKDPDNGYVAIDLYITQNVENDTLI